MDAAGLSRKPAREVLWEQDAWNDLAKVGGYSPSPYPYPLPLPYS